MSYGWSKTLKAKSNECIILQDLGPLSKNKDNSWRTSRIDGSDFFPDIGLDLAPLTRRCCRVLNWILMAQLANVSSVNWPHERESYLVRAKAKWESGDLLEAEGWRFSWHTCSREEFSVRKTNLVWRVSKWEEGWVMMIRVFLLQLGTWPNGHCCLLFCFFFSLQFSQIELALLEEPVFPFTKEK